jgi:hypothetical protein
MNKYTNTYINSINEEFLKVAFRGQFFKNLIQKGLNINNIVPNKVVSKTTGVLDDVSPIKDKVFNTASVLKNMTPSGVPQRIPGQTRSIESDYMKLLRNRIKQLDSNGLK